MGKEEKTFVEFKKLFCHHCGADENISIYCKKWDVHTCKKCKAKFHLGNHQDCGVQEITVETKAVAPTLIQCTSPDDRTVRFFYKKGDVLPLEEHWAGTYINLGSRLILVQESRSEINKKILKYLAAK